MTELIFHRGCNLDAAENSMAGIAECASLAPSCAVEIDVAVTKDRHPVLLHDLSLERLFGLRSTVLDMTLDEFQRHGGGATLATLSEALVAFPHTRFELDLRDDTSSALFPESVLSAVDLPEDPAGALLEGMEPVLAEAAVGRLRLIVGLPSSYHRLKAGFPNIAISLAERSCRDFLEELSRDEGARPPVEEGLDRIYVRYQAASSGLIDRLHRRNYAVCVTASFPYRNLENSRRVVERARQASADFVMVSPVDEGILEVLRR
ncbi:glycerophosphodiester phosphodiesterase [Nisaea sp.]|uniref:glycerophosphodiester phosphodiesterase n=1 Tax=Nisaea sp. TaxID=2024842 RepID=UPI003B51ED54